MSVTTRGPLTNEEFAGLMARLGPFEGRPEIAVAVSGGADSMAAVMLTQDWASRLGGRAIAVTVDHGLRPGSAAEAALVDERLKGQGIATKILTWQGDKPDSSIQAAARQARYALLTEFCVQAGILHLVLGQHQEDQAETFLMRLSRGSGLYGLAAMAALQEQPEVRLLRPLLRIPKVRLKKTLQARGLEWIEDPSNQDPRYDRTRFRNLLPSLAEAGLSTARLTETSEGLGRARRCTETAVAAALARCMSIHPAGIAFLDPEPLASLPRELFLRALAQIMTTISGGSYPPRLARLEALAEGIAGGLTSGATLSGCRVMPWRNRLVIFRENRLVSRLELQPGRLSRWDGRFDVLLNVNSEANLRPLKIGALGARGWAEIRRDVSPEESGFPPLSGEAVPALWDEKGVAAAPHLGYFRRKVSRDMIEKWRFRPGNSLAGVAFTVA